MSGSFSRNEFPYSDRAITSLIPGGAQRVLDFGCGSGEFLAQIDHVPELCGCDIDASAIERAKQKLPNSDFRIVAPNAPIPFEDGSFDAITMLSVVEHVPDERALLSEIHRVLKPEGRAIILVPHKGLFSFADPGNVKFRFPALHKLIHLRLFGRDAGDYARRFEDADGTGIVGCHSNRWHVHYSQRDMERLLGDSFEVEAAYGFCLFNHVLSCLDTAASVALKPSSALRSLLKKAALWDYGLQPGDSAAFLLVSARKRS